MLKFSIITVCFNSSTYIEKAIQSVLNQTYQNVEYVVVDGASTDGTVEIINRYADDIDAFISESDTGLYNAMNKGIAKATGDILFFLNSDDQFCDENVIADVAEDFVEKPDLEIVYGNVLMDSARGLSRWVQMQEITRKKLAGITINHQSIFTRKEIFEMTNGFSEKYKVVSDYDWLMKLVHSDIKFRHIDRDIVIFSVTGLSHTSEWEDERIIAMKSYYSDLEIFMWRRLPRIIRLRKIKKIVTNTKNYLRCKIRKTINYLKRKIRKTINLIKKILIKLNREFNS